MQWSNGDSTFNSNNSFNLPASVAANRGAGTVNTDPTSDLSWFGTFRGPLGFLWRNSLFYLTGGLAVGEVKFSGVLTEIGHILIADNPPLVSPFNQSAAISGSQVTVGWTVGSGVELPLANNWTWKVEYLYIDFGDLNLSGAAPAGNFTASTSFVDHVVRATLNYHFLTY